MGSVGVEMVGMETYYTGILGNLLSMQAAASREVPIRGPSGDGVGVEKDLAFSKAYSRDGVISSPRDFTSRMLKKSASFVLTALRGSTYRKAYAFASSLAAAALDGLFEHPAGSSDAICVVCGSMFSGVQNRVSTAC
jgi:hypothetical protein